MMVINCLLGTYYSSAVLIRGRAMQNLNNVNHKQAASGDHVVNNNSKENLFDRFNHVEDKGQHAKFASVLSGLKTKLSSAFTGENKGGLKTFDNMMTANKKAVDDFNELKNEKLDEDEDRKKSNNKKAQLNKDIQDLNREASELQAITTMEVANIKADHDISMKQAQDRSNNMRPSDILAASMGASSNMGAKSSAVSHEQGSVNASVANITSSGGSSSGSASIAMGSSGSAIASAQGSFSSSDSQSGQSNNASLPTGYGLDEMSDGSRAARSMMNISGVETDAQIEDNLNNINRSNLGSLNSTEQDPQAENSNKLASLNNNELRQNLDVLARESNVSKLSLQMTNPQAIAAAKADAKALADLPTSQDKIANITASKEAQGNLLNSLSGSAQLQAGGQVSSSQSVGGHITQSSSQRVNAVGTQELSSESLIKSAQAQKQSHGSESLGSRAAIANNGLRASSSKMSDLAAANSLNTAKSSLSNSATQAALQNKNVTNESLAKGSELQTPAAPKTNNAQEALMRLAQEQLGASKNNAMAEVNARNALIADEALDPQNSSSALGAAISSLKQGTNKASISTTTNYANSSLYASLFNDGEEIAPMDDKGDMDFDQGQDSNEQGASFASAMQSTNNVTQSNAADLPKELTNFAPSGNENSDANELHDKVMQMAARNLKQLSVELSPNELGKMKISISLSEDNEAVSVSLAAANPQTREILAKALPQLRDILASQHISTEAQVSDIDSDEPEAVVSATGNEQVALSAITQAAAAKRDHISVAASSMDNVSFESLVASSKSLSSQDRQELSSINPLNNSFSLEDAQDTLAAFSKGRA